MRGVSYPLTGDLIRSPSSPELISQNKGAPTARCASTSHGWSVKKVALLSLGTEGPGPPPQPLCAEQHWRLTAVSSVARTCLFSSPGASAHAGWAPAGERAVLSP